MLDIANVQIVVRLIFSLKRNKIEFIFLNSVKLLQLQMSSITIIDYSDKAFCVSGNTKHIKDKLKELGGKWNNKLRCKDDADKRFSAWIFPNKKKEEVSKFLDEIFVGPLQPSPSPSPRVNKISITKFMKEELSVKYNIPYDELLNLWKDFKIKKDEEE